MFFLDNIDIQYPHALIERVSPCKDHNRKGTGMQGADFTIAWLFVYAGGLPLGGIIIWLLLTRSAVHKAHVTLLGLFISLILTSFVTDVIKNAVGRPRPDLIDRCKPAKGTASHQLVTWKVCTETDHHTLHDGWRSFPSGHSSFAFAGLGYFSLFMLGQLHVFRPRTDLASALIAFAPLLGAILIAISRCEDYRHDVYDVTCGSILGFFIGNFTYRRYYPALRASRCHTPYPPPELNVSGKAKDVEARVVDAAQYEIAGDDDDEGK